MPPPFWALHAGRRPFLVGRMRIAAALRQFFAARDFVEVETATLVPSPGNETHLHAFATDLVAPTGARARFETASAASCTTPNSPWSSGTGHRSLTRS